MSCFSCATKFGLFKKEHGCKNCGFAFCSKCLTKRIAIPRRNDEVHSVCDKCHDILTGKSKEQEDPRKYSPPEAYRKRVAAIQNPPRKQPGAATYAHQTTHKKYVGMSREDIAIAERLEKLKEDTKPKNVPSTEDMQKRLALLKGQDPEKSTQQRFYAPPQRKTEQEQTDDLLDEICDEVELDSRYLTPQQDVEDRLGRLRGESVPERPTDGIKVDINQAKLAPSSSTNLPVVKSSEVNIEDLNKLIQQSAKELEMDAEKAVLDLQKDKELQERLAELKATREKETVDRESGIPLEVTHTRDDSEDESEEVATKRVIKQMMEEIKIDEAAAASGIKLEENISKTTKEVAQHSDLDPSEFPWCCICNSDAVTRCHDCDNDLYCASCFRKGHSQFGMNDHRCSEYKAPSKTHN